MKNAALLMGLLLLVLLSGTAEIAAVSKFNTGMPEKKIPALLSPDDLWFYGEGLAKIVPELDPDWIAVVFRPQSAPREFPFQETDRVLLARFDELRDVFYDPNLAENTCFFELQAGLPSKAVWNLIATLNAAENVDYAHPTLRLHDKTFAFFDALEVAWKTSVTDAEKERLSAQLRISNDPQDKVWRVNLFEMPLFKAVNLLAEDVHVARVTPYLVELQPSIKADFTLAMPGGNLGDLIPFALTVSFSAQMSLDPSSFANLNLKPADILADLFEVTFEPYDYVQAVSQSPVRITGGLKFYAPGEFTLPPIPIKYTCANCSGNPVRTIQTNPVTVKIASIVPAQAAANTLIIPAEPVPPADQIAPAHAKAVLYLIVSLLSFGAALSGTLVSVLILSKRKHQQARVGEASQAAALRKQLQTLLETPPAEAHWTYIIEVSQLLRTYLAAQYQLAQDPLGGSGKLFFESIRAVVPQSLAPKFAGVFQEIDTIVALEADDYPHLAKLSAEVWELINAGLTHHPPFSPRKRGEKT